MNKEEMLGFIAETENKDNHAIVMLAHDGEKGKVYVGGADEAAAVAELIERLVMEMVDYLDDDAAWEFVNRVIDGAVYEAQALTED